MSGRWVRALRWGFPAALTLLTFPTIAAADPISTFILTTVGASVTAASVTATTTFLINVAATAAINFTPSRLFGPKSEPAE
jgi:hypothetical protein